MKFSRRSLTFVVWITLMLLITPANAQERAFDIPISFSSSFEGEILEYEISLQDGFDVETEFPHAPESQADGDILSFEVTGSLDGTFMAEYGETTLRDTSLHSLWVTEAHLEGQTGPPFTYVIDQYTMRNNGTVHETIFLPILPTSAELDDCSMTEAETLYLAGGGVSEYTSYEIVDGNLKASQIDSPYAQDAEQIVDISTGIVRSFTFDAYFGQGSISYTLITELAQSTGSYSIGEMCGILATESGLPVSIVFPVLGILVLQGVRRLR